MTDKNTKALMDYGLDEQEAAEILKNLNGVEYLDFVMSLDDKNGEGVEKVINKYRDNGEIHECVYAIREYDSPQQKQLESEGFTVYTTVHDSDLDGFHEWLEENEVDYQNDDVNVFLIRPRDRAEIYKINRYAGGLSNGKTMFQDSKDPAEMERVNAKLASIGFKGKLGDKLSSDMGDVTVTGAVDYNLDGGNGNYVTVSSARGWPSKLNVDKANANLHRVTEAKKTKMKVIPASTPRNPVAAGIAKKTGGGVHKSEDPAKTDNFSRQAKHKKKIFPIEESFKLGAEVSFDGTPTTVTIPEGPRGTVGIKINGVTKMVSKSDERLDERTLGMSSMPIMDLGRIQKLAGLPVTEASFGPLEEDDFDGDVNNDMDMNGDIDSDTADFDDMVDLDFGGDAGLDAGAMPAAGDDMGLDVGAMPVDGAAVDTGMSPAYTEVMASINNIQDRLGDISLSEYRALISSLGDLTAQIKNMGKSYLGEGRK